MVVVLRKCAGNSVPRIIGGGVELKRNTGHLLCPRPGPNPNLKGYVPSPSDKRSLFVMLQARCSEGERGSDMLDAHVREVFDVFQLITTQPQT